MKKEIKIFFVNSPDYKLIPATGAWGGPNPNGEIIIDFFIERVEPPESITLEIDESGNAEEKDRSSQRAIRERQIGIVLRPDIALSIGNLLIEKANLVLKQQQKKDYIQ